MCDEVFELKVAKNLGVVVFVEYEFEILVVDDFLYFLDVVLEVNTLELEAEF